MRIVQVVHGLPSQNMAGTELVTLELSRALQARGHQVTVIARTFAPEAAEFSLQHEQDVGQGTPQAGVQIVRVVNNYTRTTSFRLHYDNPFFHQALRHVLRDCEADIVHFQHVTHLSASLIPLVSALGYPTVLSLHDFFFACHLVHFINTAGQPCPGPQQGERCISCLHDVASAEAVRRRFSYLTRVLQVPHQVLVPSVFVAQRIVEDFPFLHARLKVIPLGLPAPGPFSSPIPTRRPPGSPLRILYLGVLLPHKGAHVLLEALKEMSPDSVQVSLYGAEIALQQTYADLLRQAVDDLPVHVQLCGPYQRAELSAILAQHDVCVMPSICEETFSLVTREALHAGLPVIAARRGALPEAVQDGQNGLLFEPNNATDLRRCLRRLVDEPGLLDALSPKEFVWRDADAYAQDIEQTYVALVSQFGIGQNFQNFKDPKDPKNLKDSEQPPTHLRQEKQAEYNALNEETTQLPAHTPPELVMSAVSMRRTWLESQLSRWQKLAEERAQLLSEQQEWIDERETMIRDQQEWAETLEQGKRWLEEQRASWQHAAEERERTIVEQRAWIEELESGKRWLEEQGSNWQAQAAHWQAQAAHWQAQTAHWQKRLWGRLGLRLGLLKPAQEFSLHRHSPTQNTAAKNDLE